MSAFKVNFSGRGHNYTRNEIKVVTDVMRSADPLTQGRYQNEFEEKFSKWNGSNYSFAVSSCTAALELSALLCRLRPGDEVILPGHTFCATAIPFARTGAKLIWADIDPATRTISEKTIQPLISRRTRAIIAVHLYGLMAPMPEIMRLAKKHNLRVVEDCAQAIGAAIGGIKAGNFGDFACFSFHTHKNMTTLGEGGMLVVKNKSVARMVPGLRHNGIRPFSSKRKRYWVPAMGNVDFDLDHVWPYNFCIGEVQCALGTQLLGRVNGMLTDRTRRAEKVKAALAPYPELQFQHTPVGYRHAFHLLSALYDGKPYRKTNDDFINLMAFTYGVKLVVQYYPLYRYPLFVKAGFGKAHCPNTDYFFDNMVSFPFHHGLSDRDFNYMIQSATKTLDRLQGS